MAEVTSAHLRWHEEMAFVARSGSGHALLLDSPSSPNALGASPMELMLVGLAGCTAMDVVAILRKMRVPLRHLAVAIRGTRASQNPKYFTDIEIVYQVGVGEEERDKVEKAVALSHSTYCSALASLRPDCRLTHRIELGEEV